jgi:AAA+ ATPase superfamily predicted ATPase
MIQKIIGRKAEQELLHECYESNKPEFVAVYGRRRIGKTFLVKQFFKEKFDFYFTGAYQATKKDQLFNFKMTLESYSGKKQKTPKTWLEAFFQLKDYLASLGERRKVVFIDELPWFDTPRSNFISAIELFWNQWASDQNLMLVVCGSATSWMVNKLLGDKGGLHNRVTHSIYLAPFSLGETEAFLQENRIVFNRHQIVECYMMLGGTPYYLNMLQPKLSLAQNINNLFFVENGELRREFDFLFRSLFRDSKIYRKIVDQLSKKTKGMTRQEIIQECGITDNGKLSEILENLCNCDFIRRYSSFNKKQREAIYQLTDLFSLFHLRYIKDSNGMDERFWTDAIDSPSHRAWCGYAFEQVCLHHIRQIKWALGIDGVQTSVCSWATLPTMDADGKKHEGAQIDLVIDRRDQTINLCEMKFCMRPFEITPAYLEHIISRRELFREVTGTNKALHLTFVTTYGLVKNAQYGMIQSEVTMDDLFKY